MSAVETMIAQEAGLLDSHAIDEVDQLFEKLQVLEIHKLRSMYRTSMETARTDLHQLVSSKYRELVRIAQDVESVTLLCQQTDSALASLSYQQAEFVPFSDTHMKATFESYCRAQELAQARQESGAPILDCLIQTKLTKLDLKILATNRGLRPAPFTHTCHLVYYAQVYYTIEQVFTAQLLDTCLPVFKRFRALKDRFVDYIELQLVRYNTFSPHAYSRSNDTYLEKHNLTASDLMSGASLEIDDILWDDASDDEPDLLSRTSSQESFSEYMRDTPLSNRLKRYNNAVPSIVNYLLVYLILNHNNPDLNTLAKVAEKFLALRKAYLECILEEASMQVRPTELNFFALLQYVENTFQYVTRYFCNTENEMNTQLKVYAKPWSPSELLGMRAWLPLDLMLFNQDIYCIELPELVLAELSSSLTQFSSTSLSYFSVVLKRIDSSPIQSMVANSLRIYSNYINGIVQLNHLFSLAESPSLVLESAEGTGDGQNPILSQLVSIQHFLRDLFHDHLSLFSLSDPCSVLSQIAHDSFRVTASKVPFSKHLISEMEGDMTNYIARITESSKPASGSQNITEQIHEWFDQYNQALVHLEIHRDDSDAESDLAHIIALLAESDHEPLSWKSFLTVTVKQHFESVTDQIQQEMHEKVDLVVDVLKLAMTNFSSADLTHQYELLDILILVDHELDVNAKGEHAHIAALLEIAKQAYNTILCGVPALSFDDAFGEHIRNIASLDTITAQTTILMRPSLRLSSLLYKLSESFLAGSTSDLSNDYSMLFAWPRFIPEFAECKRSWAEKLIQNAMLDIGKVKSLSPDLLKILFIDLIYISMLGGCNMTTEWSSNIANKLCSTAEDSLSEKEMSDFVSIVASFYNSTKTILFPLATIDEN